MADLVRRHRATEHTLYRWRKRYGGTKAANANRLKALGGEESADQAASG